MNFKQKSWLWKLTGPFASDNYTTIGHTLYYPKDDYPSKYVILHEEIHERQQEEVGVVKFILLYLFCLPILWNPFRWKVEYEAYFNGSGWPDGLIKETLRSKAYGWLKHA